MTKIKISKKGQVIIDTLFKKLNICEEDLIENNDIFLSEKHLYNFDFSKKENIHILSNYSFLSEDILQHVININHSKSTLKTISYKFYNLSEKFIIKNISIFTKYKDVFCNILKYNNNITDDFIKKYCLYSKNKNLKNLIYNDISICSDKLSEETRKIISDLKTENINSINDLDEKFINKEITKKEFDNILKNYQNPKNKNDVIKKIIEKIIINTNLIIDEEFISFFETYIYNNKSSNLKNFISKNCKLNIDFINKYNDYINFGLLTKNKNISEETLFYFEDKIRKYANNILCAKRSIDFIVSFIENILPSSMLNYIQNKNYISQEDIEKILLATYFSKTKQLNFISYLIESIKYHNVSNEFILKYVNDESLSFNEKDKNKKYEKLIETINIYQPNITKEFYTKFEISLNRKLLEEIISFSLRDFLFCFDYNSIRDKNIDLDFEFKSYSDFIVYAKSHSRIYIENTILKIYENVYFI